MPTSRLPFRRAFIASIAILLLLAAMAHVWAGTTVPIGITLISSDTASNSTAPSWTTLASPGYNETVNGDLASGGYVTLTAPAGFIFNTAATVNVVLTQGDNQPAGNMNDVAVGGNVATTANGTVLITATTIRFFVNSKSRGNTRNRIIWQGIQVRPINGAPPNYGANLPSGNIVLSVPGGSTAPSTTIVGTLTQVAGSMTRLHMVLTGQTFTSGAAVTGSPSGNAVAGVDVPDLGELVATDQFNNIVTTYAGNKTISYSGPSTSCGALPTYTTSINFTNGRSTTTIVANFKKAETTNITASDGTVSGPPSTNGTVLPNAVSRLVITLPGQTFNDCAGNTGTPATQQAGVNFTIPSITVTDQYFNVITNYSGTRNLTYSGPIGTNSYTQSVNFANGESTTALVTRINTAQTTTLTVSDGSRSGPASSSFVVGNTALGSFNAFDAVPVTTNLTGAIKTKIAGTAFNLMFVSRTSAGAAAPGFTGTVKVELVDSSNTALACTTWPVIQTLANETFTPSETGRHPGAATTVPNAWKTLRVRISYPTTSPTTTSCSNDNFAVRPANFALTASHADAQTAGTTAAMSNVSAIGALVHKAGQPFTLQANARASTGAVTSLYSGSLSVTPSVCSTGTACTASVLAASFSPGTWTNSAGALRSDTARYTEVGAFALTVEDRSFADVDLSDSSAAERYIVSNTVAIGRFIPDHFVVTPVALTPRVDLAACAASTFTYMGEPMDVEFTLSAHSAAPANSPTVNYAGALARYQSGDASFINVGAVNATAPTALVAPIAAISRANPGLVSTGTAHGLTTGSQVYLSGIGGMTALNNAVYTALVTSATSFTIGVDTSAMAPFSAGGNASRMSVISSSGPWLLGAATIKTRMSLLRGALPDGPFNDLRIGILPIDSDAVTVLPAALNLNADNAGVNERVLVGTTRALFGRLALSHAHGSELLRLPMPLQTQFWNNGVFAVNAADSCTSFTAANVGFANYLLGITSTNMTRAANLAPLLAISGGTSNLTLTRPLPTPVISGSVDITIDLAAENKRYLQGQWSGSGHNKNPTARATFGVFKNGPIIYSRELY